MSFDRRDESDVSLNLAKRARRRLIGAVALVLLAAIVLPMVMDHAPNRISEPEVQIRIPGQDEAPPFNPPLTSPAEENPAPAQTSAVPPETAAHPPETAPAPPSSPFSDAPAAVSKAARIEKPAEKPGEKPGEKPVSMSPPPSQSQTVKTAQPDAEAKRREAEARRAAAILSGASPDASGKPAAPAQDPASGGKSIATASAGAGQYVIQIGAFSNETNLRQTRDKLGAVGVKTYTETLNLPKGSVTRLRAGPFSTREAAEKALQKMKSVGISGDISARS